MNCWKCKSEYEMPPYGKLSFRAICDRCQASLHCCKNCKNYKPGLPNDCLIPGTEYIADREANNFCEDFVILGHLQIRLADPKDIEKKLFGDDQGTSSKTFGDLFHD